MVLLDFCRSSCCSVAAQLVGAVRVHTSVFCRKNPILVHRVIHTNVFFSFSSAS